ncbi:PTS system, cellobiose-specific IIC component [Spiroplasma gladiatoris]|uniref:PTS system, cellobiose-specific IIC component n=1 Tax=Spiroplasma gladiatoris TaxID=2143 RepID=A0A4P7AIF5_9MOLU|nr:PTS transporter subunit EIIC [Spiroplasma gladiatoris]QBQ07426.1 PTS system, cellobiose-specific IIC component [Spiroplasma gladiatoris]
MNTEKGSANSKIKDWFGKKFVPAMNRLGSQRHLAAMRDAFGTLLPLTITGSLGLIIGSIGFAGGGSGFVSILGLIAKMVHPDYANAEITNFIQSDPVFSKIWLIGTYTFNQLNTITIGYTAIWFSFTLGYFLSLSRNFKSPILAGFASTIGFMATTMGNVDFFKGAEGLISAIIFGIIATELFVYLSNVRALYIKLPDGVPPSVSKSFAVFLPFLITALIMAGMNLVVFIPAFFFKDFFRVNTSQFFSATNDANANTLKALFDAIKNSTDGIMDETAFQAWLAKAPAGIQNMDQDLLKSIIKSLNELTNSNLSETQMFEKLKTMYEGYSGTEQQYFTTVFAFMSGMAKEIYSFNSLASMQFIEQNGNLIFLLKYQAVSINYDQFGLSAAIYQFFVSFLLTFAKGSGGLGLALAYAFFISFLWFFGIHGSNVVNGAFSPIWSMLNIINLTLISAVGYETAVKTGEMGTFAAPIFDCFMNVGGSGASLALIVGTFVFSKRQDNKKISTYAGPCGVFQINEPIVFGFPIVLNSRYLAPFILAPMVNIFIAWLASPDVMNLTGYAVLTVPWTTPFFIASPLTYIYGAGWAFVVALVCFAASFGIYTPFIIMDNILHFKKIRKENIEEYNRQMRFFNDPFYRAGEKLANKVERIVSGGEAAIGNAESQNRFWEQKVTDPVKLENRKARNLDVANIKVDFYDYKAEVVKEIGESRNNIYKEAWEKPRRINELKFDLHEKLLSKQVTDIKSEKLALQEKIKAIKEEFVAKMPSIKEEQAKAKATHSQFKKSKIDQVKARKAEMISKIKEVKEAYKAKKG